MSMCVCIVSFIVQLPINAVRHLILDPHALCIVACSTFERIASNFKIYVYTSMCIYICMCICL